MHTRGRPEEWRTQPQLEPDALLAAVRDGLAASLNTAASGGHSAGGHRARSRLRLRQALRRKYALLARQAELLALGRPLLAGLSRKSFLGHTLLGHTRAQLDHGPLP